MICKAFSGLNRQSISVVYITLSHSSDKDFLLLHAMENIQRISKRAKSYARRIMKFNLPPIIVVSLFSCLLLPSCSAQADDYKRFQLFTSCEKIGLRVNLNDDKGNAEKIGLTIQSIQNAAELKLRSARLFSNEKYVSDLSVAVTIIGHAFSVTIIFDKPLYDADTNTSFYATTWQSGSTGTHGSDSGFILQALSKHIDKFLVEYLRVNEKACEKKQ